MGNDLTSYRMRIGNFYGKLQSHPGKVYISMVEICFYVLLALQGVVTLINLFIYLYLNKHILNKYPKVNSEVKGSSKLSLYCVSTLLINLCMLLLILSNDVETNPGPHPVKDLKICHLNIRSLKDKVDILALELGNYDIITLSETWLDPSITNTDIHLPGFQNPIRNDRNRHGGGS